MMGFPTGEDVALADRGNTVGVNGCAGVVVIHTVCDAAVQSTAHGIICNRVKEEITGTVHVLHDQLLIAGKSIIRTVLMGIVNTIVTVFQFCGECTGGIVIQLNELFAISGNIQMDMVIGLQQQTGINQRAGSNGLRLSIVSTVQDDLDRTGVLGYRRPDRMEGHVAGNTHCGDICIGVNLTGGVAFLGPA